MDDARSLPAPTPEAPKGDPVASARIPQEVMDAVERLRDVWPDALEGKRADRSPVLRALIVEALPMMDPQRRALVAAWGRARGLSMEQSWAEIVEAGMRAVGAAATPPAASTAP